MRSATGSRLPVRPWQVLPGGDKEVGETRNKDAASSAGPSVYWAHIVAKKDKGERTLYQLLHRATAPVEKLLKSW